MSGWGCMELLNIEIDHESQWEAIYHVLLLPASIAIWPIVHPQKLRLFCLLLKSLPVSRILGGGELAQYQLHKDLLGSNRVSLLC